MELWIPERTSNSRCHRGYGFSILEPIPESFSQSQLTLNYDKTKSELLE
jgi:hypothetical protein